MQLSRAQMRQAWESDKRKKRKQMLIILGITIAVFLFCLCFRLNTWAYDGVFVPLEHLRIYMCQIRLGISGLLDTPFHHQYEEIREAVGIVPWGGATLRLRVTIMAFAAGAGLAIAGAIFQTIYKNPMASPNILGATSGVQIGNIIMVTVYSSNATSLLALRYKYCYILTAVCVAAVILLGKLSGDRKGNPSVMQMVMAGSVISQAISSVTMYYMYQLTEEDLQIYQQISMGNYTEGDILSFLVLIITIGIGLTPMLLMRYRLNVTGIDDAEARVSGINPAPYRMMGQIFGVLLVAAATIHFGEAGMLTMVVPYVVRAVVGADFRRVAVSSMLFGGALMMICKTISTLAVLRNSYGDVVIDMSGQIVYFPATFVINICLTPVFMVILAKHRRAFA